MKGPGKLDISKQTHLFFLTLVALALAFATWASVGRLDVVSFATGSVVPSSQVKTVQHLEGGIISDILVREGDRVARGQPLMTLESTASDADVQELSVRIISLQADVARLEAEVSGKGIVFDPDFAKENRDVVAQTTALFENRRVQFANDVATQTAMINQRLRESDEIRARLANTRQKLKLLQEQIAISTELMKDNLTNRMLHLNLLKEAANLDGTISEDNAALERLAAAYEQERLSKEGIIGRFRIDARTALDEKRRSLDEFKNRVRKFQDSFKRSVLVSPVEGVVMTLYVVTRGGVIQPGAAVADIVPVGDAMVVEAQMAPQDVGYVRVGQMAKIRLASADGARFLPLQGTVTQISPDTVQNKDGNSFYKVRIKTKTDYFESDGERYQLVPGVQVMSSIITGSRSVLEYVASPFLGSLRTALQER